MTISNLAAGHIAIAYHAQGLCTCPVTAPVQVVQMRLVMHLEIFVMDIVDIMIAGGCEAS